MESLQTAPFSGALNGDSPIVSHLDLYGLRVSVGGDWPELVEDVRLDFAWFEVPQPHAGGLQVTIERRAPDFDAFEGAPSAFVTPRNVVYQVDGRTVVDYFGRAVSVFDRRRGHLVVQGEDSHLVHEAVYQFLLSRTGEHLDRIGMPRLHALGLAGAQGGIAVLLPSGGGKSTLALRALRDDAVKLVSEDSPLIDRRGRLHPFPLRIGVNAEHAATLPEGHVRLIERMEFHPKAVLAVDAFADRIEREPVPLRHLIIGRRSLARTGSLQPIARRRAVGPLVRESVVGVGLYQGLEFVLQRGMRDAFGKLGVAFARSAACAAVLRQAQVWRLTLGRDDESNWRALEPLLR